MSTSGLVQLAHGAEENPFALLLVTLLGQNLDRCPERAPLLRRLRMIVTLNALDLDAPSALEFRGKHGVTVHSRPVIRKGELTIEGPSDAFLDLARLKPLGNSGIPALWSGVGPVTIRRLLQGKLRMRIPGKHLLNLRHLLTLISVY